MLAAIIANKLRGGLMAALLIRVGDVGERVLGRQLPAEIAA